jgi:hypothetical protein
MRFWIGFLIFILLMVGFALWLRTPNGPRRAYDRCMASERAQLRPGEALVDDADCQPLLRGQP